MFSQASACSHLHGGGGGVPIPLTGGNPFRGLDGMGVPHPRSGWGIPHPADGGGGSGKGWIPVFGKGEESDGYPCPD